jgi:TctA family transporter
MTAQSDVQLSWLDGAAVTRASDLALGGVSTILGAATLAIAYGSGTPFSRLERLDPWFFPAAVGGLLALAGVILLLRGSLLKRRPGEPWSLTGLVVVLAIVAVVAFCVWQWGLELALLLGPADYVALIAFALAAAIAVARLSRLRAVAMALIGLLLAIVGIDISTGTPRMTMGAEQLLDGIGLPVLALALTVVADAVVCVISPNLLLATYTRQLKGWSNPRVGFDGRLVMRIAAPWVIAGAGLYAFWLNYSWWDVGLLVLFGAFGVICKILGWNRLVPLLAFAYGPVLEEFIRRALVISKGDLAIFWGRPLSAGLLLLAFALLAVPAMLSVRRALSRSS